MLHRLLVPLLAATLSPGVAIAAEPSFDCAKAETEVEHAICASEDLADLDWELARLYDLARHDPKMGDAESDAFTEEQRDWIAARDSCLNAESGVDASCVAESYVRRIDEIRSRSAYARGEDVLGASLGPFLYRCDGLDAEVWAVFVNAGDPARLSLRWRSRWLVLRQVLAASGARYQTETIDGAVEFWIKGSKARFSRPGRAGLHCETDA